MKAAPVTAPMMSTLMMPTAYGLRSRKDLTDEPPW